MENQSSLKVEDLIKEVDNQYLENKSQDEMLERIQEMENNDE